jgi:predicted transcriptional regulator
MVVLTTFIVKQGSRLFLRCKGFGEPYGTAVSRTGIGQRSHRLHVRAIGYTFGMKTAVSIPDEVFQRVERFARRAGRSRSEVFSAAIQEYVARHAPDEVTDAMDRVCADIPDQLDAFVRAAGRRVLERTEW